MGITNGTASANADEERFGLFADNAPPVNYCGELHRTQTAIFGALRGIRDDFKGVVAAFGTVDMGYRGEIGVTLFNHSGQVVVIAAGDRIAQIVVSPVVRAKVVETDTLSETERGTGGFGSTGA